MRVKLVHHVLLLIPEGKEKWAIFDPTNEFFAFNPV